ncbi:MULTISPECIES: DUF4232 domain-containing protein [unclassified Streptomyces]|uniref:DUF4232 domain-containing protein n=1 Tax=unclassified Streptomyces TaxID=2593676 RepID=UPI002E15C42E|nr:DUF4232 domain-containing protein [Streptomyces sp. NBC_01197]WSS50864.1 DUF4232 domain-containing protein [Streptomyces sp. NBC_01180]
MQIRRTRRALTFLAVAGVTVLATAACGTNGSGATGSPDAGKSAGSSVSGSPAAGSSTATGTSASKGGKAGSSAEGAESSGSSEASGNNSGGSGPTSVKSDASAVKGGSHAADATCSTQAMKIALVSTGGTLPAVVLRATNASGSSCDLYGFPTVGYDGAQAAVGADEHSKPQAVVTLAPGQSGYAAISLPNGAHKHREKALTVGLLGRDMGPIDGQATVMVTSGSGIALSDSSTVSYWQSNEAAALQ